MYMIVMLVYVLLSGQQMEAPIAVSLKHSFDGFDKCQAYLASSAFAIDRTRLSQRVAVAVTLAEQAKAEQSGEPPPVMDTAITASCEIDNRL